MRVANPVAMMSFYWLTLGILCVWRVTHLLYAEDGPWNVLVRLRRAAGAGFLSELLDCFFCTSLWVSIPFAIGLGQGLADKFLLWLGMSGGACLLQRLTEGPPDDNPVLYIEDEFTEEADELLRQTENADSRQRADA